MLSPETLPPLRVLTLNLFYEATETCSLPPYSGTTMRGALGHSLRHRTCETGAATCEGCKVAARCVYGTIWDGMWADVPRRSHRKDLPATYVVEAPWQHRAHDLAAGDSYRVTLRLIGPAMEHVRDVIKSAANAPVSPLGRTQGSVLRLVKAAVVDVDTDEAVVVFDTEQGVRLPDVLPLTQLPMVPPDGAPTALRVLLTTPLKVTISVPSGKGGDSTIKKVRDHFDPKAFTQALLDRIEHLYALEHREMWAYEWQFYVLLSEDVQVVSQQLEKVFFKRDSMRLPNSIDMKGMAGEVVVTNVHPALLALWKYAEYINAGKEAAFGFGHVQLLAAHEGIHF